MSVENTVENVYLRHNAVQLTRKHFWRLLGMTLLVSLISIGLESLLTWFAGLLRSPIGAASAETLVATTPTAASSSLAFVINLVFMLVSSLTASGLNLGYNAQLIDTGRGGVPKIFGVFKRMRYCLKGWGLNLLTGLKILLWMLPGFVAVIAGVELDVYGYSEVANWVVIAGSVLIFGLIIPAAIRYSLAPYIMADEPERGIRECITLSKGLMKGRKWQYFKLGVPMVLKMIGVLYAVIFSGAIVLALLGMLENMYIVLGLTYLAMLPSIYFGLQMNMAYALFYLKRREPAADAPVSYWLRQEKAPSGQSISAEPESIPADEASPAAVNPLESPEESPEDTIPETNEEKENDHE